MSTTEDAPGSRAQPACLGCVVGGLQYLALMSMQPRATEAVTRPSAYPHAPHIGRMHASIRRGSLPRPLPTDEQTPHGYTPERHRDLMMFHPRLQAARWAPRDPRAWDAVAEVAHPNLAPKYRRIAAALRTLAEGQDTTAERPGRHARRLLELARAALDFAGRHRLAALSHGHPDEPRPTQARDAARLLVLAPCAPPHTRGTLASA